MYFQGSFKRHFRLNLEPIRRVLDELVEVDLLLSTERCLKFQKVRTFSRQYKTNRNILVVKSKHIQVLDFTLWLMRIWDYPKIYSTKALSMIEPKHFWFLSFF